MGIRRGVSGGNGEKMKNVKYVYETMADARKAARKEGYKSTSSDWALVDPKGKVAHVCYDPETDHYGLWFED